MRDRRTIERAVERADKGFFLSGTLFTLGGDLLGVIADLIGCTWRAWWRR